MKNVVKRDFIIPEMIPDIIEIYDKYYNGLSTNKNLKDIGNDLNKLFSEKFKKKYSFDESAYRKTYKNIKDGINIGIKEGFSTEELNKIAKAKNDLILERRIANKQRQEANNTIKILADNEIIKNVIINVIGEKYFNEDYLDVNFNINKTSLGYPVYCLSDVHYGSLISTINNIYNTEIAKKRIEQFFEYIYNDCKNNKYEEIYIIDCGDMIEGSTLRISQLVNITELIVEQSIGYVDIISSCLRKLSDLLGRTKINYGCITDANHQQIRHFSGKPNEYANEDFGIVIYHLIKEKMANIKNIEVYGSNIIILDIDGNKVAFAHGHQYKINEGIDYIKKLYNIDVDCLVQGHWHNFNVVNYGSVMVNEMYKQQFMITLPSVCGNTDYSVKKGYSAIPAGLKLLFKNSKVNNMELIYLI